MATGLINSDKRQRFVALALLVVVVGGVFWLINDLLISRYRDYGAEIDRLQSRLQTLNRMLATRGDLEAKITQIRQDPSMNIYALKQASPTIAATDLQQRVKEAVESNGGELISTQILPVVEEEGFVQVIISIRMNGDTEIMQKVLHDLESEKPLIFIDNLQITARTVRQRRRSRDTPPETTVQLTAQFDLAGYIRRGG
jgi:general secretion pathway protein M